MRVSPIQSLLSACALLSVAVGTVASCGVSEVDLSGKQCPCGDGYVCDTTQNVCVLPGADGGVPGNDASTADANGTVTPKDGSADAACPEAGCPCKTDVDCTDPSLTKCAGGVCVACTPTDDRCPVGRYCTSQNECTVGCKSDAECLMLSPSAPYCNQTRRQCVQCKMKSDCQGTQVCSPSGTCVDACAGEAGACTGNDTCCSGLCVNTTTDVDNCNVCGNGCMGAQTLCCSSSCTDPTTSASNCGSCGYKCSTTNATPSCAAGACTWACTQGYSHCATGNTGCETNTNTTINHCGSCSRDCNTSTQHATGISCSQGHCGYTACAPGYLDCDTSKSNGCETMGSVCPTCGLIGLPCCTTGPACTQMGDICQAGTCIFDN
jgi:hypothetical protein